MKSAKNNSGMALIMAVAIVGILAGIAATFAYNMKIEQKAAGNFKDYLKAKSLAEAGAAKARAILGIYSNNNNYLWANFTSLNQSWALGNSELTGTIGSGEYVYDVRYTKIGTEGAMSTEINTLLNLTSTAGPPYDINGHIIRGVVDEESKLNIAKGTNADTLIDGLADAGFITSVAGGEADELKAWADWGTVTDVLRAGNDCNYGTLYGDDDGNGDKNLANNHKFDSAENDGGTANCLDGGIEDIITISSPSIDEKDENDVTLRTVCPVNVNTAPLPVLIAVLSRVPDGLDFTGTAIGLTKARTIALAIIEYRDGYDDTEGTSDDNPFDGMDTDGLLVTDTGAVDNDPQVIAFASDGIDNDTDGTTDEADEQYMFPGGARGEFNAFVDNLSGLTSAEKANIKDNADSSAKIDYDADGNDSENDNCTTAPFIFHSKYFTVISEGKVLDDASNVISTYKVKEIVGPFEDSALD